MMKALTESGLVSYEPYAGVTLTEAGTKLARRVLRRHRLVELFLVEVMGMDWSEVHSEAEILEHAVSDRLIERIDEMLGHPAVDPHGDPIPTEGGAIDEARYPSLLEAPLDAPLRVVRVTDQRTDFLKMLERSGLVPGSRVKLTDRDELAESVCVLPDGKPATQLGFRAGSRVEVEPL